MSWGGIIKAVPVRLDKEEVLLYEDDVSAEEETES